jgi:hypothetical protein
VSMLKALGLIILGIALGCSAAVAWMHHRAVRFDSQFQAILLDTGQVYYGHLEGLGTSIPVITDVYYVNSITNPQTKEVANILVRRGKEWHAPDRMYLNARHIVMVEPVSPNSKVAQLIAETNQK